MRHISHEGRTKPVFMKKAKNVCHVEKYMTDKLIMADSSWLVLFEAKKDFFCVCCAIIYNVRDSKKIHGEQEIWKFDI